MQKVFDTRIMLKADEISVWQSQNPTPLDREPCVVIVPASTGAVAHEPIVLMKIGDGKTPFNDLPFLGGLAADVYDWAKAATKPEYTADEITGLADYIAGEIEDTDTQYKLEQDENDKHVLRLYSKVKGSESWSEVASVTTIDTVYDDTALSAKISALETLVGTTSVAAQIASAIAALDLENVYEKKGAAATEAGKVQTNLDEYKTSNNEAVAAARQAADDAQSDVDELATEVSNIKSDVTTLKGEDSGKSAREIASEEVAKIVADADASYDTLKEIADWISTHADSAASMNTAIVELQKLVGTLPDTTEATSVIEYINELISGLESEIAKKANAEDLHVVATTGNIADLEQTEGDVIIFDCGSATVNI